MAASDGSGAERTGTERTGTERTGTERAGTGLQDLANRLGAHIDALTRHGPRHPSNSAGVDHALLYLTSTLDSLGYPIERIQYGPHRHNVNIVAQIPGTDPAASMLDVGAHWDSVPGSPGADDNASGVAALLEVSRALAGTTLRRTVRLCFFGDEESSEQFPAGRGGSQAHVRDADAGGEHLEGAIILEMVGYRDDGPDSQRLPDVARAAGVGSEDDVRGTFITAIGDPSADDYVRALAAAAQETQPALPVLPLLLDLDEAEEGARSDHARYWATGRKAVMLTDTAEFRNPHYHRPSDTLDTLDLDFAAQVTYAVVHAVRTLAG